jgi:nucleotide-binding universal stress UspA family protein
MSDYGRVLIAYDGSDAARAAVERVPALFPGRPATVVAVWQSIAGAARAGSVGIPAGIAQEASDKLDEEARGEAQALADEAAERLREAGMDASATAEAADTSVASAILEAAEREGAEVVAVGSRGRSAFQSALLGSVSNTVVHHSPLPVLVVRAPDEQSD